MILIAIYLKVVRANPVVRGFPVREESQVELSLARRLRDLAQSRECQLQKNVKPKNFQLRRCAEFAILGATVESIGQQRAPECPPQEY